MTGDKTSPVIVWNRLNRLGARLARSPIAEACRRRQTRRNKQVRQSSGFRNSGRRQNGSDALQRRMRKHVAKEIGSLAKPDDYSFYRHLPKTVRVKLCAAV
jgi:hypothetical protein